MPRLTWNVIIVCSPHCFLPISCDSSLYMASTKPLFTLLCVSSDEPSFIQRCCGLDPRINIEEHIQPFNYDNSVLRPDCDIVKDRVFKRVRKRWGGHVLSGNRLAKALDERYVAISFP